MNAPKKTASRPSLDGITLEMIVTQLSEKLGWEALGAAVPIRCFTHDPSIKSSLKFLRRTPWARSKVERLYLQHAQTDVATGDKDALSPEELAAFRQSTDRVRAAALAYLSDKRGSPQVINFVRNLQSGVDQVVAAAVGQGVQLACKAGCSHCCHALVEALEPEIFRIAQAVAAWPEPEINALQERLQAYAAMPSEVAPWARRMPCAFLVNDLCSIYEVRPGVCRKGHSLDVAPCAAKAPEIPQSLNIVLGAEALLQGTSQAYREIGLHAAGHDLGPAVLIALADPTAESRWLNGEAVFD